MATNHQLLKLRQKYVSHYWDLYVSVIGSDSFDVSDNSDYKDRISTRITNSELHYIARNLTTRMSVASHRQLGLMEKLVKSINIELSTGDREFEIEAKSGDLTLKVKIIRQEIVNIVRMVEDELK